jgi:hypothetical protein
VPGPENESHEASKGFRGSSWNPGKAKPVDRQW